MITSCVYPTSRRLLLCASSRRFCLGGPSSRLPLLPRLSGALAVHLAHHPLPLTHLRLPMPISSTTSCFASALSKPHAPRSPQPLPPLPPSARNAVPSTPLDLHSLGDCVTWSVSP